LAIKLALKIVLTGAGATMSSGKKARELTKISVNKKIAKMIVGMMYCRKNATMYKPNEIWLFEK
jgi:hypothetical protein